MRFVFQSIFLCFANWLNAQISGVVADSQTKLPVPFVNIWIESAAIGTTATEDGKFAFAPEHNGQNAILSAVGYESRKIKIGSNDTIFLIPKPIELAEVAVGKGKHCEMKLGKLKGKQVSFLQYSKDGKTGSPMIMARYFPNTCDRPIFLKQIKIKPSASRKATFNVRLYAAGEDGAPGNFLYDKNILISINSLALHKTIDVEKLHVAIPENGFFVAVEWLIIDENKRSPETKNNATPFTFWEPGITAIENPGNDDTWYNSGGHWARQPKYSLDVVVGFVD